MIEEGSALKLLSAIPANEAVRMPLTIKRRYIIFHDSTIATTALGCEHVEIVLAAIGLAIPLVETLLSELLAALSAKEVLGMPSLLQGGHTFIKNGPVAVSATRREQIMIVRFAVRMTLPLEEVPCTQLLVAVSTCEMFWMPRLAQCRYHLAHDRLLAGAAASFLGCVDTLAAHVGLKIAEHRIQLILLQRLALSWMVEVSRVSLGNVNAGLRALVGQRAL